MGHGITHFGHQYRLVAYAKFQLSVITVCIHTHLNDLTNAFLIFLSLYLPSISAYKAV